MKKIEETYLKVLLAVFIVLLVGAIASLIYALVVIFQTDAILNNILELVYMGVHIIALVLGISFIYNALKSKKGSYIMKTLMIVPNTKEASKRARIIAIILSSFGFLGGVYFTLVLCGTPLPYFNFPIALLLDLVNSPFSVCIVGLFFIFYPNVYQKC